MRRLVHKPVALAQRQRRSCALAGLRLPQPRPPGVCEQALPFSQLLPDLLLNLTHTSVEINWERPRQIALQKLQGRSPLRIEVDQFPIENGFASEQVG